VNNSSVPPPPPAPVVITQDDPLTQAVKDAIKDIPGITATVEEGVVKVAGNITKTKWTALKKALDALNPKKVDGSGLTIK
ncbi:MAG TPA: BON domain-containing protein, partial [Ferruginibacter sp.]|nr:BON domain-containing protein [Ferruginibacter sp.]